MTPEEEAIHFRSIAASERAKAAEEPLLNAKGILLQSAERWEQMTASADRVTARRIATAMARLA